MHEETINQELYSKYLQEPPRKAGNSHGSTPTVMFAGRLSGSHPSAEPYRQKMKFPLGEMNRAKALKPSRTQG